MKTIIATVALSLTTLTAFAQEATLAPNDFVSMKSRAEVQAPVLTSLASGQRLSHGEAGLVAPAPVTSETTRAAVHQRVLTAIASGERLKFGEALPNLM